MPTFKEIYKKRFGRRVPSNSRLKHGQKHTLDAFIDKLEAMGDPEVLDQFQVLLWRLCLVENRASFFGEELQRLTILLGENNIDTGREKLVGEADTGKTTA